MAQYENGKLSDGPFMRVQGYQGIANRHLLYKQFVGEVVNGKEVGTWLDVPWQFEDEEGNILFVKGDHGEMKWENGLTLTGEYGVDKNYLLGFRGACKYSFQDTWSEGECITEIVNENNLRTYINGPCIIHQSNEKILKGTCNKKGLNGTATLYLSNGDVHEVDVVDGAYSYETEEERWGTRFWNKTIKRNAKEFWDFARKPGHWDDKIQNILGKIDAEIARNEELKEFLDAMCKNKDTCSANVTIPLDTPAKQQIQLSFPEENIDENYSRNISRSPAGNGEYIFSTVIPMIPGTIMLDPEITRIVGISGNFADMLGLFNDVVPLYWYYDLQVKMNYELDKIYREMETGQTKYFSCGSKGYHFFGVF